MVVVFVVAGEVVQDDASAVGDEEEDDCATYTGESACDAEDVWAGVFVEEGSEWHIGGCFLGWI